MPSTPWKRLTPISQSLRVPRLRARIHPATESYMNPSVSSHPREPVTLEKTLGHVFASPELLHQALTHSSQARESEAARPTATERAKDNEQLEFLGDAVLG